MLTLEDAIPCSICGSKPVLAGGTRTGRLRCPNYKSKDVQHGNLNSDTNGITMGFTHWCNLFWSSEQSESKGIPTVVEEWNYIHKNGITNKEFAKNL